MGIRRSIGGFVLMAPLLLGTVIAVRPAVGAPARQEATPTAYSCATAGTPMAESGSMSGMEMGTPTGDMAMDVEFDQHYIDMMIPHHASIVALAQAALPELTDPRLQEIAQTIIDTQTAEQDELRGYREEWYGSPDPMAMDMGTMMDMMMPGTDMSAEEMAAQMDPATQVAAFCAGDDPDLTFIDLIIPHHESAIMMSEAALEQATRDETKAFAERVIEDQQREIDELVEIRAELTGTSASPSAGS